MPFKSPEQRRLWLHNYKLNSAKYKTYRLRVNAWKCFFYNISREIEKYKPTVWLIEQWRDYVSSNFEPKDFPINNQEADLFVKKARSDNPEWDKWGTPYLTFSNMVFRSLPSAPRVFPFRSGGLYAKRLGSGRLSDEIYSSFDNQA